MVTSCVYDESLGMFRVTIPRGKTLTSSGFGVLIDRTSMNDNNNKHRDDDNEDSTYATRAVDHLFIEEVIYLNEKGLLNVLKEEEDGKETRAMESWELMDMLEDHNVPLAAYLTYAYLRAQTYIVIRHRDRSSTTSDDNHNNKCIDTNTTKMSKKVITRRISANAPPPRLLNQDDNASNWNDTNIPIAFDVYNPNSSFKKTSIMTNTPDFVVVVTLHGGDNGGPTFETIRSLLAYCDDILSIPAVRLAVVADGGAVLMYGIGLNGVPDISNLK